MERKYVSRKSNFELLRIISMFLIVVHHFSVHGTFASGGGFSFEKIAMEILEAGGKIGANVFVLIGSYFLIGKKFNWKRPLSIALSVLFYSYGILLVAFMLKWPVLNLENIIASVLPIPKSYWFATYYLLLLFFAPALNVLIAHFDQKQFQSALLFLTVIWVFIPTFLLESMGASNLALFIYLYFVAGYIKKYPSRLLADRKAVLTFTLGSFLLTVLSVVALNLLGTRFGVALKHSDFFLDANKLLTMTNSIGLFLSFKKFEMKSIPTVNWLAGSMFGVYLIHDNKLLREMLWAFVDNASISGGMRVFVVGIAVSLLVFGVCLAIDVLKRLLLDKYLNTIADRITNFLSSKQQTDNKGTGRDPSKVTSF